MKVTRVGLDLAKAVFQVHGVDAQGKAVVRERLKRARLLAYFAKLPACLIGIEASGGAHYWARELTKLGHTVRLMAPQFVTPYRQGGKNDYRDAEAICEAVGRARMRFVPVKSVEQQALMAVHRARALVVGQRNAIGNQLRGLLAEFGIVVGRGVAQLRRALPEILEDGQNGLPGLARQTFAELWERLIALDQSKAAYDAQIRQLARASEPAQRLTEIEGVGEITATAALATVGDAGVFRNGRQFSAWLGVTPRQRSSGERQRLGGITKQGDTYLRTLFIHGARAAIQAASRRDDPRSRWIKALVERRGKNRAAVALANKNARIVWAMLRYEQPYRPALQPA